MENCKRCPFCHKLPMLIPDANMQIRGGCTSGITEMCGTLRDVVYQPNQNFAVNQWNYIVAPLAEFLATAEEKAA